MGARFFAAGQDQMSHFSPTAETRDRPIGCSYVMRQMGLKAMPRFLSTISFLITLVPAYAQETLQSSPKALSLLVPTVPASEQCRRFVPSDASSLALVSLHRTFNDDFDEHPLAKR